jgi:alkaline phosphatase D
MNSNVLVLINLLITIFCISIAPRQSRAGVENIVFGSCIDQNKPQPIWKEILKIQPDLLVLIGDNVYASKPDEGTIASQYEKQNQNEDFKLIRANLDILAIWDDHDFGQNDGGSTNPRKYEARTAFVNNFPYVKKLLTSKSGAIYHSRYFGKNPELLQLILLDTRFDRSDLISNKQNWLERILNPKRYLPNYAQDARILSDEQWKWLDNELTKAADFRILVSSIQLIADDYQFEKWGNFPNEKKRFYDLLIKKKIKNLVVVSGDRHFSSIAKTELNTGDNLYELTASSINRPFRLPFFLKDKSYLQDAYQKENFGQIKINWKQKKVHIEVRNKLNEKVRSAEFNF